MPLGALNAAVVDLDYYKGSSPPSWQEVVELVNAAVEKEAFPMPSLLVNSGQGAWLVWLLVAEGDSDHAPTAPPMWQRYLHSINTRLASLIAESLPRLAPDAGSADLTRHLRIPGSIHSATGTSVNVLPNRAVKDGLPTYTLDGLAAKLSVPRPTFRRRQVDLMRVSELRRVSRNGKPRGGRQNLNKLLTARIREIELIEQARNGFERGHRNKALLIIAATLHRMKRSPDYIHDYLSQVGARCRPPVSPHEIRGAITAVTRKQYDHKNVRIAQILNVSVEEANALGLKQIRPDFLPKRPDSRELKGRYDKAVARREALQRIVDQTDGPVPTLRKLVELLSDQDFKATTKTVGRDLDVLGIGRNRKRGRSTSSGQLPLM